MKIIRIHNRYQQRGGEDSVFEAESTLLERHGHNLRRIEFTNDDIPVRRSLIDAIKLAGNTIWSNSSRCHIGETVDAFRPDVVHFDNTFPLISPAVYEVVKQRGVSVVQTLHNFRFLCPSATLFHNGDIYEDNVGKSVPWRAVRDRAYRRSFSQTAVLATMLTTHRLLGTYRNNVDRYIALTEFQRQKFIGAGFNSESIVVKPNFPSQFGVIEPPDRAGFLFVGRLSPEKGVPTLLSAFSHINQPLAIAGNGSLAQSVETATGIDASITYLGRISGEEVVQRMASSLALVFPSEWYEGFPMTIVEAFASGTPVIASRLGSMAEIIEEGVTGLHFEPGNAEDLAAKITWAAEHPEEMRRMGENARREYESKYTAERNYEMLMAIYHQAIAHSAATRR